MSTSCHDPTLELKVSRRLSEGTKIETIPLATWTGESGDGIDLCLLSHMCKGVDVWPTNCLLHKPPTMTN